VWHSSARHRALHRRMDDFFLAAYTPYEPFVERPCVYRQWRLLKGEAAFSSDGKTGFDGFSAQQVTSQSFDMEGLLGEGNYSQIFQAKLRSTYKTVALKVIDKAKVKRYHKMDEVLVERWVLSRLRHPSIVELYHAFQDVGAAYLSMECVPGGELWQCCHNTGLPMTVARNYAAEVLEVMQFLHERDVVHRDIKPENVLISESGHVKMIDFGTAKLLRNPIKLGLDDVDESGSKRPRRKVHKEFVGTPEYMAPEAINNKFVDQRADLWSFGCFVAMLITGKPPFRGGSDYLTFKRALAKKYQLPEGMPAVAADLIHKLLVIEPHKRLGGRWPEGLPAADKLDPRKLKAKASSGASGGDGGEGGTSKVDEADFRMARTYDHEAIRAHPFFEGLRSRELYKEKVPLPMLSELAMREVMMKVRAEGAKALGPPATIARWPAPFKDRIGFECFKRDLLTNELRGHLGMGPPPPPIEDDLDDLADPRQDAAQEDAVVEGDEEEEEDDDDEDDDEDDDAKKKAAAGVLV